MEEAVAKAKYLTFRKQRKAYFSRYPVPADLRAVLGKDYLTAQIGVASASEVERQHRRNLSDFDKQISEARLKASVGGSSTSHARLRESFRLRKGSLNIRLAKLPTVDSIPEYRLAYMIEGWFEKWFS